MKKALAIISFGTSYTEGEKAIIQIENYLEKELKEYDCFRAFTSKTIIKKIEKQQGRKIPTPEELLDELEAKGYDEVICQPTHMLHGIEYDALREKISFYKNKFSHLKIGFPMLHDLEDYKRCAKIYQKEKEPLKEGEAIVLMGHGTEHFSNSAYCQMEKILQSNVHPHYYIGTVEGYPTLLDVMKELKQEDICTVYLAPFMIVAGEHACRDMAGEEEDSWKNQLKKAGYEVEICLNGFGEYKEVGKLFAEHVKRAKDIQ